MGLFDRKAINPIEFDPRNAQRKQVDSFLADFVSKYGGQYQPGKNYEGNFTAPMSTFERQGFDQFLPEYLNAPNVSGQLNDVRTLLNNTVKGGFDPGTSEYYKALRGTADYNRKKAVSDTNADLGARGKYFSSEAVNKYGDINAQTANSLNTAAAELADRERTRSMTAAGQSASLEDYISKIPLQKTEATQTYGSLSRLLEQNDLESLYQDFIRKQDEGKGAVSAASGVSSTPIQQTYQAYKPSAFETYVMPLLKAGISSINPMSFMSGGGGAAAGASAGAGAGSFADVSRLQNPYL